MKKLIFILMIQALIVCKSFATVPDAPVISLSLQQENNELTVSWESVANATSYRLHYRVYQNLAFQGAVDLGAVTSLTATLGELDSFIIKVTAVNGEGESSDSNQLVAELNPALSGGETTIESETSNAFATPAPNLSEAALDQHLAGDADFEAVFVTAPASVNSGLGPVFNHRSCDSCHGRDGRGAPPESGEEVDTLFLRLSVPGEDPITGGPMAVSGFGTQLFQRAVFGVQPEAKVTVTYAEQEYTLANGMKYSLRTPTYHVDPYMPLPDDVMFSPRIGPPVFGRGLLEAIDESTIVALADQQNQLNDGISGRVNRVWHPVSMTTVLGRFGLKANNPDLLVQSAGAYHGDIGVTTPVFYQESSTGQLQDDGLADDPEVDQTTLENVTFYTQTLAVPARRNVNDPQVMRGQIIFAEANCQSCHTPVVKTGTLADIPSVSNQLIRPYTDMLLHDMGEGLADNRPDFLADGHEWRTPPLWGIGLSHVVNGHTFFLHDGRARNVLEAIMWHGGEAENSRDHVQQLSVEDIDALIAFVNSI